jgi:hypothetical protein
MFVYTSGLPTVPFSIDWEQKIEACVNYAIYDQKIGMISYLLCLKLEHVSYISITLVAAARRNNNNVLYQSGKCMAQSGYDVVLKS